MSDSPLVTYMQDHLAGATAAVQLIEQLRDQHQTEPVGDFAARLLAEVEEDRATLDGLAQRLGGGSSLMKDATGWLGAQLSRLKIGRTAAGTLGTFEALETIALGVLGKLALWRALSTVSAGDPRLAGVDFGALEARAEAQHARVEQQRIGLAPAALRDV
jgi:hypothetical protein